MRIGDMWLKQGLAVTVVTTSFKNKLFCPGVEQELAPGMPWQMWTSTALLNASDLEATSIQLDLKATE